MLKNNEHALPETLNSRYQILGKLGSGGMASVIKARDIKLKRLVALKFLSSDRLGDKRSIDRLVLEAQTISKLNHPNICILHDILEYKNTHFLVMELVEGETLRAILNRVKVLPAEEAIQLAIQIATALKVAHDSGIIHRDIKPENIMITPDGHVKVMDFGLAKLRDSTEDATSSSTYSGLKSESGLYGTDAYMSPEQIDNLPLDEKTDIFSLGIVIYEMVTGRNPFSGDNSTLLMKSILHTNPPSLHTEQTGLLYELDRIVQKSLAKDPAQRQRDMHELILQLQNIERGIPEKTIAQKFRSSIGVLVFFLSVLVVSII
ncbi:serine/threonine protein kinase, partial [candidate division KSB1 bacterium]